MFDEVAGEKCLTKASGSSSIAIKSKNKSNKSKKTTYYKTAINKKNTIYAKKNKKIAVVSL